MVSPLLALYIPHHPTTYLCIYLTTFAYSVGPYWGVTPQVGQLMQNNTFVMSDGETFPCLPQGTSHYSASHPSEIFDQPETAPIQSSSWSVPPLHTSAASQLSATVHGEWSPTDEDLQARQNMMDLVGIPSLLTKKLEVADRPSSSQEYSRRPRRKRILHSTHYSFPWMGR